MIIKTLIIEIYLPEDLDCDIHDTVDVIDDHLQDIDPGGLVLDKLKRALSRRPQHRAAARALNASTRETI